MCFQIEYPQRYLQQQQQQQMQYAKQLLYPQQQYQQQQQQQYQQYQPYEQKAYQPESGIYQPHLDKYVNSLNNNKQRVEVNKKKPKGWICHWHNTGFPTEDNSS